MHKYIDREDVNNFASDREWMKNAACHGLWYVFFPPEGLRARDSEERSKDAIRICNRCEVKERCLEYAQGLREPYGVWGAQSAGQRMTIRS